MESAAESWLRDHTTLPAANRRSLAALLPRLAARAGKDRKTVIGIAGAPGSGKSTLAGALAHLLNQAGRSACLLSLDDYYLPRDDRQRLAELHHPLLRQRGAPGTHELDRLMEDLDRLRDGAGGGMKLPVFDKSTDERLPEPHWRRVESDPDVVLLEGWCVGAPPCPATDLERAINDTEKRQDADGYWRRRMHYCWTDYHLALQSRLDAVWYIRVPGWDCVVDWRWQQECELARPNLGRIEDVRNFLGTFERVVRHMQNSHQEWADVTLSADRDHCIGP